MKGGGARVAVIEDEVAAIARALDAPGGGGRGEAAARLTALRARYRARPGRLRPRPGRPAQGPGRLAAPPAAAPGPHRWTPRGPVLRELFGHDDFRPGQARDRRGGAGRPRLPRRHADRRRQVAHLPAPGPAARRHHPGDLAAHRADEGPGGRHGQGRAARHLPQLDAGARGAARPGGGAAARRGGAALRRAGGAGGVGGERALRARRSRCWPSTRPTASATGATTSAPPTGNLAGAEGPLRRAGAGAHRHRHPRGDARHRQPARHGGAAAGDRLLPAHQPEAPRRQEGGRRPIVAGRHPAARQGAAAAERHRLRAGAQDGGVGGRVPRRPRRARRRLPRRARRRPSASACRTPSPPGPWRWWWPPSPSAWASTRRTSAT